MEMSDEDARNSLGFYGCTSLQLYLRSLTAIEKPLSAVGMTQNQTRGCPVRRGVGRTRPQEYEILRQELMERLYRSEHCQLNVFFHKKGITKGKEEGSRVSRRWFPLRS